jgi:hypothetical protein
MSQCELLHLHAEGLAGEAPPAVAAHRPRRAKVPHRARVDRARAHRDAVAVILQPDGLQTRVEAHARVAREAGAQHPLEGRLVEEA